MVKKQDPTVDMDEFDIKEEQTPDRLAKLESILEEATTVEDMILNLESDLVAAKKVHFELVRHDLPNICQELNITSQVWNDWQLEIKDNIQGSIPKDPDKKEAALGLLEKYGASGLIQTKIAMTFAKSEYLEAKELNDSLIEDGHEPVMDSTVNHMTLKSFVRERLENGEPMDNEVLGVFVGKIAKLKKLKKK